MGFIGKAVRGVTNLLGITGDVPKGVQTQTGFFPPNVNIDLPLFSARQTAGGSTIANTAQFTPEGLRIEELLKGISGRKADELAAFVEGGDDAIIEREQKLFQEAAAPDITRARNQLRNDIIAGTGGLFTTPGGQQAMGAFEAELTADTAARNLQAIDRAEARRKLLEGEELDTLNSLVAFQNQPITAAQMALSTGGAAAAGNTASAQLVQQNELQNRAATGNFLTALLGGFMGTKGAGSGNISTAPIYSGVPTSSQAGGFGMDFRRSTSAFSTTTPQFSGGFSSTPRSNYFMGEPY